MLIVVTVMWSKHFNPAFSNLDLMRFFFHTVLCRGTNEDWHLITLVIRQFSVQTTDVQVHELYGQEVGCAPERGAGAHRPHGVLPVLRKTLGGSRQLV